MSTLKKITKIIPRWDSKVQTKVIDNRQYICVDDFMMLLLKTTSINRAVETYNRLAKIQLTQLAPHIEEVEFDNGDLYKDFIDVPGATALVSFLVMGKHIKQNPKVERVLELLREDDAYWAAKE